MKSFRLKALGTAALVMTLGAAATVALADARGTHDRSGMRQGPALERIFGQFDANGDGSVTREEFDSFQTGRFAEADANGDGKLSADELLARWQGRAGERITAMIERMDANGDGMLDATEMARPRDNGDRLFGRLDENGDGTITLAEAEAAMAGRGGQGRGHGMPHHGRAAE